MVVVQMAVTKRAVFALPMCPSCNSRWTVGRVLRSLSILVPVLGGLALAIAGAANDVMPLMGAGFLLVFPGVLAVIPVELLVQRPRILRATFIDDTWVTLKGFAPQMIEVLRRG
jgi:hypothetical protein